MHRAWLGREAYAVSERDEGSRSNLQAQCDRCFGLCCVAPAFSVSADFAIDKPAGRACPNLQADFRCGIHNRLRPQGFAGCTVYDCFGAGQQISQVTFGGRDWRDAPETATQMFDAFAVMRQLHELLWYLTEALALPAAGSISKDLGAALDETRRLTYEGPGALGELDIAAHRAFVNELLARASELERAGVPGPRANHRGADLIGGDFRAADLRGANLRGAFLIAADLTGADLTGADVIGADLRDADVRGADLAGCIFLIQSQLDAARGDEHTKLPGALRRPAHWPSTEAP